MDKLEKYILENHEQFDSVEPSEGHFDRFAQKLEEQNSKKSKTVNLHGLWMGLRAASVILLAVLSTLWLKDNIFPRNETMQLSNISPEYQEVEFYYTSQINTKLTEIKEIDLIDNETQKKMLLDELEQMDSIYSKLALDLEADPSDERVVNAMINHYKVKLTVLNRILKQLYQLDEENNKNQNSHESLEI